jgi:hypothetical protein
MRRKLVDALTEALPDFVTVYKPTRLLHSVNLEHFVGLRCLAYVNPPRRMSDVFIAIFAFARMTDESQTVAVN